MHPLVCSGFVLLLGVLDASGQSWLVDMLLEFDGGLNQFLPRIFHKVRQGVNLVMIAAFTLVTGCG